MKTLKDANQRYAYISGVVHKAVVKKAAKHAATTSDKIDRIVTNSGTFEEAEAIIEAYENDETEVYFYDDESGDTDVVEVD